MRSEMPWMEPRSPWTRLAPTAAALIILGAGVGGAVRIVRAQDNAPAAPTPKPETDPLQTTPASGDVAPPVAAAPESSLSDADRQKLQKELDGLERQRAQLDSHIGELRAKLGTPQEVRVYRVPGATTLFALPAQRALTPEERKRLDAARQELDKALHAYQQALRSLPPGAIPPMRFTIPPVPDMPTLPATPQFSMPEARDYQPYLYRYDRKDLMPQGKDFDRQMQEFNAHMKAWEQEFRGRMETWQKEFESQMRQQFHDHDGDTDARPQGGQNAPQEGPTLAPKEDSPRDGTTAPAAPGVSSGSLESLGLHRAYSSHDAL